MSLVHNEKTKLTATWLNSVAAAAVAVGGIAPSVAAVTGTIGALAALALFAFWVSAGVGLHLWARSILSRLKDNEP